MVATRQYQHLRVQDPSPVCSSNLRFVGGSTCACRALLRQYLIGNWPSLDSRLTNQLLVFPQTPKAQIQPKAVAITDTD